MYIVHIRVQCAGKLGEAFPDSLERAELFIEDIISVNLLKVFDTVLIDTVLIENLTFHHSPDHIDEDNSHGLITNFSLDILLRSNKLLSGNVDYTKYAIEDIVGTILSEFVDTVVVENITIRHSSELFLQINEEPLTAQNFTSIMSAFTELYTKFWLIAHGRFADLIEYTQTHNERFAKEANLVIVKMTHNSPVDIKLNINVDASIQGFAEAIRKIIDAIMQASHRRKAAELANQVTELDIKQKALEAQVKQAEREQNLQIAAQQADLDRQKDLIEIRQQQIQVEKQQIELDKEFLELNKNRLQFVRKEAGETVDMLHPGIDAQTRAMLIETLIPNLLQAANGQGLVIALPEPKKEENK